MTTEQIVQWAVSQGIGAVLALVMFLVYRADSKTHTSAIKALAEQYAVRQTESATAWMAFGKEQGSLMVRITSAIERIEERLDTVSSCPVTHVTTTTLTAAAERGLSTAGRETLARAIPEAVRSAIVESHRDRTLHEGA